MGKNLIIKGADFSTNAIAKEYTPLAWISQASTAHYFVSNIMRTQNMKIEAKFAIPSGWTAASGTGWDYMAGNPSSGDSNIYLALNSNLRGYAYEQGVSCNTSSSYTVTDNNFHTLAVSDSGVALDGTIRGTFSSSTTMGSAATSPLYFMGLGSAFPTNLRYSEFKVWSDKSDDSSLILHLVPVIKSDNTVCMLDVLTGNYYYTSDGTSPNYGTE
jgi:hypothetical protein